MSNDALTMRGPVSGTKDARKVAIGSGVGAVIETYDFIGFGTAAALYFGTAFFPGGDPVTGTLAAFATLGVGFAARPIGGIIGGHLGDKLGRKPVLVASLILMGLATFAIGLLPTYQTAGIIAPILLVLVRIVQGLAFGAEWGGAILMSYEHAPWKQKGKYTSIVQAGFPVGLLLANLVFLASGSLGGDWAWRVPFLASIVLVAVGLIIRAKVPESPVFEDVKEHGQIVKNPIIEVIKTDWRNIVRGIGLRIAETAGYAVSITYMISYLHTTELADKSETLIGLVVASGIGIFATMAWGRLTDRVGRRPVYIWSCLFAMLYGIPMFLLVNTGLFPVIIATMVISYAICQNSLAGAQGAWFPELFNANTRSSGASLAYQISAMVAGFTPFVTTLLFIGMGWVGPALLFSFYAAIGLWAALITRETWGKRERQLADQATTADVAHRAVSTEGSSAARHSHAARRADASEHTDAARVTPTSHEGVS
ncbi:MFS transporter [Mycetocola zhujimingii]|uniref:MFS transporter n=1 Tax=Mycetocola zhujimingii TaxID=2079792 RepID=UPI000D37B773|nr:MFS transporter [Mycetocola zhujimingii]AWB85687.1 MFS transporter [Mycetocola zhujimingii]